MLMSNRLPLLKRMRVKSILNHNNTDIKKGTMLVLNLKSLNNLDSKLGGVNIKQKNLIQQVYHERRLRTKIGISNVNLTFDRDEKYKEVMTQVEYLRGINEARLDLGYNVMYDLTTMNTLFDSYSTKLNKVIKPLAYSNFIFGLINDPKFNKYTIRTMVINAEEYNIDEIVDVMTKKSSAVNPIGYLYLLMKNNTEDFLKIGNIDIIITNKMDSLRINPYECESLIRRDNSKNISSVFRTELFKLINRRDPGDSEVSDAERIYSDNLDKINYNIRNFSGGATGELSDEAVERIAKSVAKSLEKKAKEDSSIELSPADMEIEIEEDVELKKAISDNIKKTTKTKETASSKRDELLREKQLELKIKGKTVKELMNITEDIVPIGSNDVSDVVDTINKNVTEIKFPNINKTYMEEMYTKDLTDIVMDLNKKSIPVFVRDIKVEDTSNISNAKETYTVELEDSLRVRHRLTFDMPKIIDDRFLYIGGNRLHIINQQMMLPICKVAPDTVQLVSNYNKIFIRRYGNKVTAINEKLKKSLLVPLSGVRVNTGKFDEVNNKYVTTIDYDDLSKNFKDVNISGTTISFDQENLRKEIVTILPHMEKEFDTNYLPIGYKGGIGYFIDLKTNLVVSVDNRSKKVENLNKGLVEFITSLNPVISEKMGEQNTGKKFMYSRATIMAKDVPIILLTSYFDGLDNVMKKAGVKHYFSETRPRVDSDETVIEFEDGYLVYSNKPFECALLMNGLLDTPTKYYKYQDFNTKVMYQELFEEMYKRRNLANAFENYKDNFVDPITYNVLQRLNLPLDLTGMILYANSLMADNQYTKETEMSLYRIRSMEIINALLYKQIATAYERYKDTSHRNNPIKISVRKDAVLRAIQEQVNIENYSELNPVVELEKLHTTTKKGVCGVNLSQAYTAEQRSFSPSMTGIYTISSSPDANVGVQRTLTVNPPIQDGRGFIDNKVYDGKVNEYNDSNLFGIAEMLTPTGVQRDDSIRTAMSTKQFKHAVPVAKSSPTLISNGMEKTVQYHLSKDWVFVAKEDGKVVKVDNENGLMIVEYKSGKCEAININVEIRKNGAGGFYISKQKQMNFKEGQSFKKNEILAHDDKFFSQDGIEGNRFNVGSLQKVALLSSYATFEDSSRITKKVSRDMSTEVVMCKPAVLGPNTNVDFMVKVGDKVSNGDELLRFERSFEEDALNSFLFNIGEDLKEEITMGNKDKIKSKYSGEIVDIKIFSSVELEELSPSLRKIVSSHYKKVKSISKMLDQYDPDNNGLIKCGMLLNEAHNKVETNNGKFRGEILGDGVLIEFYIKVHDECGVGDKICFFSALKSVIGEVVPEGLEGYSLYRPEEEIGAVLSCNSIIARGIASTPLIMISNKLIIEESRQLREIFEGKR